MDTHSHKRTMKTTESNGVDMCSTDRLLLRRPRLSDRGVVYAIHADPMTNRFNPHGPATVTSSETMLLDWITHWENFGFGYWAISSNEAPDQIIGFGGIVRKNVADRLGLNLYFRFAPKAWGKGFASETATAALSLAFTVLRESEVLAKVRTDNHPSRRVLERIGMSIVGETEDVPKAALSLIYAISAADHERSTP
jgi:ribosomal-protein-alanine N-acetyltransferase